MPTNGEIDWNAGAVKLVGTADDIKLQGGSLSITGDGSNAATLTETGAGILTIATVDDFIVDAGGDISLDADGGDIRFKDAGTEFGRITHVSSNFFIQNPISDGDFYIQGNDGGSTINMLYFDTSNNGYATFSGGITSGDSGSDFYGIQVRRSGSGTTDPDIWGTNNTLVLGTSSSTEVISLSNSNATFAGTVNITAGTTGSVGGGHAGIVMTNKFDNPDNSFSIKPQISGVANTGLEIRDETDNASRLVINGSGNVGIGTTSPGNKLTIASGTGGGSAPDSRTLLHIDKNGEAYISINSPAESFNGIRLNVAGTPKAFMELYDNTPQGKKLNIGTVDARDLVFDTGNQPKMTILSGGNVGIGTTSPDSPLDVRKNDSATTPVLTLRQLGSGDASINFQTTTSPYGFNLGVDGSDSDAFKIAVGLGDVGTDTALKIDTSKNATFAGKIDVRGTGYNQIHIAHTTSADTNKQSGITTSNYEGNNVSIFQTFQQNNNNTIYFGSADGSHRGLQNYRFYVNTDSDAVSGHAEALHIGSDKSATFEVILRLPQINKYK